jgi:hypothetical protein
VVSTFAVIGTQTPIFLAVILPVGVLYYFIQVNMLDSLTIKKLVFI